MRVEKFILTAVVSAAFSMGSMGPLYAQAGPTKPIQLVQSVMQKLMPPKAKSRVILEQKLDDIPGYKVVIVEIDGPPGWVGGQHYHPGHVFGFVTEGTYQVDSKGLKPMIVQKGEAFYERPNTVMRARNASKTEPHKNVVFLIIREGKPKSVSVK